jgi:hypothetical protein
VIHHHLLGGHRLARHSTRAASAPDRAAFERQSASPLSLSPREGVKTMLYFFAAPVASRYAPRVRGEITSYRFRLFFGIGSRRNRRDRGLDRRDFGFTLQGEGRYGKFPIPGATPLPGNAAPALYGLPSGYPVRYPRGHFEAFSAINALKPASGRHGPRRP